MCDALSGPRPPMLMRQDEVLTIKKAASYVRRSEVQIRRWCKAYGISRQATPTSPLEISRVALVMVMHADFAAIELLREGKRSAPEVAKYIELTEGD